MVMWKWYCVITATLYVYFVDQCHSYIPLISTEIVFILLVKANTLVEMLVYNWSRHVFFCTTQHRDLEYDCTS